MASVVSLIPEQRDRQPRQFPVVTPDDSRIYFSWPGAETESPHREVLDAVLARIARVGHSSCLVSCRTVPAPLTPATWLPSLPGPVSEFEPEVRTLTPGLYDALVTEFERHQGASERVLPALMTRYRQPGGRTGEVARQHGIGDWIVLPLPAGARLPIGRTQDVTRAVRGALMAHASQPVASVISGHPTNPADTTPLDGPHMALLALPNVSHRHADGLIHAVALCLPSGISGDDRDSILEALQNWSRDSGGEGYDLLLSGGRQRRFGVATLNAADTAEYWLRSRAPRTVVSRAFWSRVSQSWSSVTPVALDRHPRIGRHADYDAVSAAVAPVVVDMCQRVGLPSPIEISVSPEPIWAAVPAVGTGPGSPGGPRFPQFRTGGRSDSRRFTTNLSIRFAEPVGGPVVIGAGRFFGYGLMLPTPAAVTAAPFGFEDHDDARS